MCVSLQKIKLRFIFLKILNVYYYYFLLYKFQVYSIIIQHLCTEIHLGESEELSGYLL